ncbi:MAG: outer membrane lipoprotein carrier protein LolA, partial [Acidobacteriaceae bacterium]|nr:outer membrane lipoprotein carrier protein LolA [Acidobacteriaceae bacterium]
MSRLIFFALWGSICLRAAAVPADDLIKQVQGRYNNARTLSVQFVENYSLLGHGRPPETGTLTLRKQGKMRWDYTRPAGKLFISDGKTVYLYTAADNRVEKVSLKDTEDMRVPLAFLLGRLEMKKEFRDFTVSEGEGGNWLKALPKTDRVPYKNIEMLIASDGSVRQLKVAGRDESLLAYTFENEKVNPPVAESAFRFTIPPGAQVVDAVEFRSEAQD